MTKYESAAMSEFTVWVDKDVAKAYDHLAWEVSRKYSDRLQAVQMTAMAVWMVAFIRVWIACLYAVQ